MELFTSKIYVTVYSIKEFKRNIYPPRGKVMLGLSYVVWIAGIIALFRAEAHAPLIISTILFLMQSYLLKLNPEIKFKKTLKKHKLWGIEKIVTFSHNDIQIYDNFFETTTYFEYNTIARLAESETLFALFTNKNEIILINKFDVTQEKSTKNFLSFIADKCANIKIWW